MSLLSLPEQDYGAFIFKCHKLVYAKMLYLNLIGTVYTNCIKPAILYGNEELCERK